MKNAIPWVVLGAVAVFLVVTLIYMSCSKMPILHPDAGVDYPCGYSGVVCRNGMCCSEGEVCGGEEPSCPTGMCCYVGEGRMGITPHPQLDSGR